MEITNIAEIQDIAKCGNDIWKTFKGIIEQAKGMTDKEKVFDFAFAAFRDQCQKYSEKPFYGYAVRYAQDLMLEIERMLYPGKPKPEAMRNTLRMTYPEFVEYVKDPEPGDMITILNDDGGNLARVKIRTVIKT